MTHWGWHDTDEEDDSYDVDISANSSDSEYIEVGDSDSDTYDEEYARLQKTEHKEVPSTTTCTQKTVYPEEQGFVTPVCGMESP